MSQFGLSYEPDTFPMTARRCATCYATDAEKNFHALYHFKNISFNTAVLVIIFFGRISSLVMSCILMTPTTGVSLIYSKIKIRSASFHFPILSQ